MFKRKHEIENLNAKIKNREKLIDSQSETIKKLREENKDLRYENEELRDVLRQINMLLTCNTYNNKEKIYNKIKELVDDYQSIN